MSDYYSIELLEKRVQSMKAEMRFSMTKAIVQQVISSFFLAYVFQVVIEYKSSYIFLAAPVALNAFGWLYWLSSRIRYFVIVKHLDPVPWRSELNPDFAAEEFRRYESIQHIYKSRDNILDIFFGLQFLFISIYFASSFLIH
ncbi:MAG: hypothetical protein M0R33_21000 [Methylomonas sp.]|jgi:hypothetical protein|uniref:hypothetical protein n=1 Tax=Methylomonas sp. TaxID=418 RepID=UPI0025F53A58|nr:hypothetical protein [Methylomonas sp.]MCK9608927.1 hypothetical protein [Methylomonas sp.]